MKFMIVGSQKTGNVWLERLLTKIYNVPIIDLSAISEIPPPISEPSFVTHQHYLPMPELLEWGEREGVQFLTILRHPGDIFVSFYHYVNTFAPLWANRGWIGTSPTHLMIGEEIDSPKVLEFMRGKFRNYILKSVFWLQSQASLVTRYEDLKQAPVEILKKLTDQIRPVDQTIIAQAVEACRFEKMREESELMRMHCRKGKVGSWQEELGAAHINILQECYERELAILGYSLNEKMNSGGIGEVSEKERVPTLEDSQAELGKLRIRIDELELELASVETVLEIRSEELGSTKIDLQNREAELDAIKPILAAREQELASIKPILAAREQELASIKPILAAREQELASIKVVLETRQQELENLKADLQIIQQSLATYKDILPEWLVVKINRLKKVS